MVAAAYNSDGNLLDAADLHHRRSENSESSSSSSSSSAVLVNDRSMILLRAEADGSSSAEILRYQQG